VYILYNTNSLQYDGQHDLPILVKLAQGKQFYLDLQGTTLQPTVPHLHLATTPQHTYSLYPVAVGTKLHEAPVQYMTLHNLGSTGLMFELETEPIDRLNSGPGMDVQVLELCTSSCGIIGANSSQQLRWRFLPLQARTYAVQLTVRYAPVAFDASSSSSSILRGSTDDIGGVNDVCAADIHAALNHNGSSSDSNLDATNGWSYNDASSVTNNGFGSSAEQQQQQQQYGGSKTAVAVSTMTFTLVCRGYNTRYEDPYRYVRQIDFTKF
jgi:hypothetical protein